MALFALNRFNRNGFHALVSALMLSAVLAGCGSSGGDGSGGGGLPGTTFRSGNITADSPELTALTAAPNTAANRVNIAGNIVDVVDDGDDDTTDTPALSFAAVIDAGGNPAAPTGDAATPEAIRATLDSLWIVSGGVVNNILDSAAAPTMADQTAGNLHIQNFEVITIDGGTVNGNITGSAADTIYTMMSGTVGTPAVVEVVGVVDDPATTEVDETVVAVTGVAASGGDITGGAGADIFNLIGGTITGDVNGGAGADSFVIGAGITIGGMIDGGAGMDTLSLASGFTPTSANLSSSGVLTLTLTDDESLTLTLTSIETIDIAGLVALPLTIPAGTAGADTFAITTDITNSGLNPLESVIDGLGGADVLQLNAGAVVASVAFSSDNPTGGAVHLQSIETITLDGGTVTGAIDASAATAAVTFNLTSGTITGGVTGSDQNDTFIIGAGITINGIIDGGDGDEGDNFILDGGVVNDIAVVSAGNPAVGDVHLRDISFISLISGDVMGDITGLAGIADIFTISGDLTSDDLNITGMIDGGAGNNDVFRLNSGGVVNDIAFTAGTPAMGDVHLQDIETITISGGTVTGTIDASNATAAVAFNLTSGTITGDVIGTSMADGFRIGAGITINGMIDGGAGANTLSLVLGFTPTSANLFGGVLTLTLTGGDSLDLTLTNIATDEIDVGGITLTMDALPLTFPAATAGADTFAITTDITDSNQRQLESVIDGLDGTDVLELNTGATVVSVAFSTAAPTGGAVNLRNIETITLDGGTVNSTINASGGAGVTFNLISGVAGSGGITGSPGNDIFIVSGDITPATNPPLDINGVINGGVGTDEVRLVANGVVVRIDFGDFEVGQINLQAVETITMDGGTVNTAIDASAAAAGVTFNLVSGRVGPTTAGSDDFSITGSPQNDTFIISGDTTGDAPALDINGIINGGGGTADEVRLVAGGVVGRIDFGVFTAEELNLDAVEIITIDGGTVNNSISASFLSLVGITFNLRSGTITGFVSGSRQNDTFNLYAAIRISSIIDGNTGTDVLRYAGAPPAGAGNTNFATARGGLDPDGNTNDTSGEVRNIESQEADANINSIGAGGVGAGGAGLRGLTVRGIEVLGLSPALNLYGAMSDALMQFGQQTAQGFALADLNLATGRATQLMSKDSPFTTGRIWAHKITHSGNGKGSIGLNLTGLTARADSDYDYEMSLTQHGFDAPLATTRLGAFNLRAVSHTMTGVIETDVAEAQVSGYGAGVALLWNSGAVARQRAKRARAPIISAVSASAHHHGLSAHITSLAGAYEVEAHTSPLNPRAVVSEVSEGSFSAINAVVSAGVADTRKLGHSLVLRTTADIVWQTLSLDDFTETGSGGIAVNFDKATRFTARVGAGLEGEHWFSDVVFVHETSSGGTLSSGLEQDYRQDDGTAIEMKIGGKLADLATGLTLKAYAGLRTSLTRSDSIDPSAHLALNWRF